MKICVYGAGSIGGVIGGVLANAGHDVSLIARGAHLEALRANGCRVETGGRYLPFRRKPAIIRPISVRRILSSLP
jgi:ketopantoate reductase